jgi:hypothetical protein
VLYAYLNYPNARVSLHGTLCGHIQQAQKTDQRRIVLNPDSLGTELRRFVKQEHDFAAQATNNDMWLDVDFADWEFEESIVRFIHRLLAARYKRFHDCTADWHCR